MRSPGDGTCNALRRHAARRVLAAVVATTIPMLAAAAQRAPAPATAPAPRADTWRAAAAVEDVIASALPAVVQVLAVGTDGTSATEALRVATEWPSDGGLSLGMLHTRHMMVGQTGSGFIVDSAGYVVTNAHVVRAAQVIRVLLRVDDVEQPVVVPAVLVGADDATDIAVLRVVRDRTAPSLPPLPSLRFGRSATLRPGQLVLALGSPHGLPGSVTMGVVSATERALAPDSDRVFLQTDARLAEGSSGGPLMDVRGNVVGVTTAMVTRTGAGDAVGLALPADMAHAVYAELRAHGRVRRADLGMSVQAVTRRLAGALGYAAAPAVVVSDLAIGGSAERAGVQVGDRLLAVDDRATRSTRDLAAALIGRSQRDSLRLRLERKEPGNAPIVRLDLTLRVETAGETLDLGDRMRRAAQGMVLELGVVATELDDTTAVLADERLAAGVLVTAVAPREPGVEDGLEVGDVVVGANGSRVRTIAELRAALQPVPAGGAVVMQAYRRGALRFVAADRW